MNSMIQVSTTSDQKEELEKIASALLEQRLAACCQISGPISSHYQWEGKPQVSEEWICTIKTNKRLFSKVEETIQQLHHYDVPEVIAVEITNASSGYQKWVNGSVA